MSGSIAGLQSTVAGSNSSPRLSADLGTFLKLLTTQLQNQDPTKPMDTEQLTQQLTLFATVEQQIQGNQTLSQLLALQQAGQLANSAAMVGRRVTVESDTLPLQGGQAEIVLPAAGRATRATVEIRDAAGSAILRQPVTLGPQPTRWPWDGLDGRGNQRPDGSYRVVLTGEAEGGATVALTPAVTGTVTGAARVDGNLMLRFGTATIGFDKVRELPNAH
ncbi:flagellar hook assembly protein FlgD [Falsiroseomonas sp. HW251]|uniref:flagellar hook assembly protein FlgD n=1 Tax=Falsiroseomonas sp. HW251 TaxID=3390998 RepID=UPI003D31FC2D